MLHGISLTSIFLLALIEPLNSQLTLTLLNEDDKKLYFNINDNEEYIIELNEDRKGTIKTKFNIEKKQLKDNNTLIIKNDSSIYEFNLNILKEFNINYIDKTTYYLGYYLESKDNKVPVVNNVASKLEFINIDSNIIINDVFDFSLSLLPKFKINKGFNTFHSSIYLFVKEGTYPFLTYSIYSYQFPLDYKVNEHYYEFILDGLYYFEDSLNYLGDRRCYDLFLPSNYKNEYVYFDFKLEIDNYIFSISYKTEIKKIINKNSSYFKLIKEEVDENNEKKLIYSF